MVVAPAHEAMASPTASNGTEIRGMKGPRIVRTWMDREQESP